MIAVERDEDDPKLYDGAVIARKNNKKIMPEPKTKRNDKKPKLKLFFP